MKHAEALFLILIFDVNCVFTYRNNAYKRCTTTFVTSPHFGYARKTVWNGYEFESQRVSTLDEIYEKTQKKVRIYGINEDTTQLHPDALSNVESQISQERIKELEEKGFMDGDSKSWRNWHVLTQGQWDDIGSSVLPPVEENLKITEPYALRKPLKYWGFLRGVDTNITSYPVMWEYYNNTIGQVKVAQYGGSNPMYNPGMFQPRWNIQRDRRGLGYDDVRCFTGWTGLDSDTPTRVKAASPIVLIPDAGRRYQKFYMGPYPITMGWTIGSLLKVITQSRCPGHGVVALKIHNMNEDTTVSGVQDDLLNIALNLKGINFETIEPGHEARIRTKIKGPAMVCAGGIEWPWFVKLATPEAFITNIEEGGELDIEFKLEWGRGLWMADQTGLHRMEEGADSVCMKRRQIKEVDEEGFYPTSVVFGGCRMIRLAVHKLMGQRWCLESNTCPDPMEQLVVEIWTDLSTTPRAVLRFGLNEVCDWLVELKRQVSHDTDFDHEDEELKDTWEKIDKYSSLKKRQDLMGGPPIVPLHKSNLFPGLKENQCQYVDGPSVSHYPQAPFSLPQNSPKPPNQDTLEWLAKELQNEEYSDPSNMTAEAFRQFINAPPPDTFEHKDIRQLPVDKRYIETLRMCGFNTMGDVMKLSPDQLSRFPNIPLDVADEITAYIKTNTGSNDGEKVSDQ